MSRLFLFLCVPTPLPEWFNYFCGLILSGIPATIK
jgi:hypothetical protein